MRTLTGIRSRFLDTVLTSALSNSAYEMIRLNIEIQINRIKRNRSGSRKSVR